MREPAITGEFIPLFIQTIIVEVTYESSGFCHQVFYFVTDQKPHDITVPVGLLEKTADFFSFSPLILCLPHQLSQVPALPWKYLDCSLKDLDCKVD